MTKAVGNLPNEDSWVDARDYDIQRLEHPLRTKIYDALREPKERIRAFFSFLGTSPGHLALVTVLLIVAISAAGIAMGRSAAQRQSGFETLITVTEPMANASRNLYTSLSIADSAATASFITDQGHSSELRNQYREALAQAHTYILESATGVGAEDTHIAQLLLTIEQKLTNYNSFIDTARTNERLGNPVGAAYLSEASGIMRNDILPAANELVQITNNEVATAQNSLTRPQWVPLSGLVAALIFLILGHIWLSIRTRRRINIGFAIAIILMFCSCLIVGNSTWTTYRAGVMGYQEASTPLSMLTTSRIAAQQARTDETLSLIMRTSSSSDYFDPVIGSIRKTLTEQYNTPGIDNEDIDAALDHAEAWKKAHDDSLELRVAGEYSQALDLIISGQGHESFESLDNYFHSFIESSRTNMRAYIIEASSASRQLSLSVIILTILSVISLWLGIRPRFQEYR